MQGHYGCYSLSRRLLLGLLGTAVSTALGCGFQGNHRNPKTLSIGLIAPMSGKSAIVGVSTQQGAQLAAQEINQAGGITIGRQQYELALIVEDNQDNVDEAVNVARKLIFQDDVLAIVGPQLSRNAIPVAKFVETYQVLMISPRSTNPATTAGNRYVFRCTFTDPFQGHIMTEFARSNLKAQQAAVLFDVASAYNRDIAQVFKQVFEQAGGRVVAFEAYTTGAQDYREQIAAIQKADPEVLFLPNYDHELPQQIQQIRAAGVDAMLLGSDSWGVKLNLDAALMEGAFYSDLYAPDSDSRKTRRFISAYKAAYGSAPNAYAAATYDTLYLLKQTLMAANRLEPEAMRSSLANLGPFEGVTGKFNFQGSGDPIRSVVILQLREGKPVFFDQISPTAPLDLTPKSLLRLTAPNV